MALAPRNKRIWIKGINALRYVPIMMSMMHRVFFILKSIFDAAPAILKYAAAEKPLV
jgi:hypothetical protein